MAHTWRGVIAEYADRLPVGPSTPVISLGEGGTPLVRAHHLSEMTAATCTSRWKARTRPARSRTAG
jgi:threonine synthase